MVKVKPMVDFDENTLTAQSPLLRTFQVLGDGWTFLILREAFFGVRRFDEFQKNLDAPRSRLTERLTHLLNHKVLLKRQYSDRPPRYEYLLNDSGHDLYGVIMMMMKWGQHWRPEEKSLELKHSNCNAILKPQLICLECRKSVLLSDVQLSSESKNYEQPKFSIRRQLSQTIFEKNRRNDPVARTLSVIGDQWTMSLLRLAFRDKNTFETFRRNLGISRGTLSSRLSRLVEEGILMKTTYCETPQRYTYDLTPAGRDLFTVALMMFHWGEKWLFENGEQQYHLVHGACGKRLKSTVICAQCQKTVSSRNVDY